MFVGLRVASDLRLLHVMRGIVVIDDKQTAPFLGAFFFNIMLDSTIKLCYIIIMLEWWNR